MNAVRTLECGGGMGMVCYLELAQRTKAERERKREKRLIARDLRLV